jgi:hypothetical protein
LVGGELLTPLEELKRHTARHRFRDVLAKLKDTFIEKAVAHELNQVAELFLGKPDRIF